MNKPVRPPISEDVGSEKHRQRGENFTQSMHRQAVALADNSEHQAALFDIYTDERFLNAGRVQAAVGSQRQVTAFNCFVAGAIPDSMEGIMQAAKEAALTMQKGGGIGYDFSTIRPKGALVKGLDSSASGVVSFMEVFNSVCATVASAGNRRGAQMGVLMVGHPDILEFIEAKTNDTALKYFNISVGITDEFMEAVVNDAMFTLRFDGTVWQTVRARELWEKIMQATWDWAEPGVLFVDRMNEMNNLWYMEDITATNPCGEQPLPPHGACLLGSINWTAYVKERAAKGGGYYIDVQQLLKDIPHIVRALDNVIDRTIYPLPQQEQEAKMKRRMGIGSTGVANALEAIGCSYGTPDYCKWAGKIQNIITNHIYCASIELAKEKGSFPALDREKFVASKFIQSRPPEIAEGILEHGIRNSHLTSIAPNGSISLAAGNISSGIEPVFSHEYDRTILMADGTARVERVEDYGQRVFGVKGRTADQLTPAEHVGVLLEFQKHIDSACSKTCNVGADVPFEDFKDVYMVAWRGGAKGCTTFRAAGKRFGVLNAVVDDPVEAAGEACYIDPATGKKTCD